MGEMTDEQLVQAAKDFRDGILDGAPSAMMCAAVSWPLASFLRVIHGIEAECIESDLGHMNHVWILLPDGRALDATADQFTDLQLPPVYLGKLLTIHVEPEPTP